MPVDSLLSLGAKIGLWIGGIVTAVLVNLISERISGRLPSFSAKLNSISGLWVARVKYTPLPEVDAYDVVRIRERRGKVSVYLEHYSTQADSARKVRGDGLYNPPHLSAFYGFVETDTNEVGVLALRSVNRAGGGSVLDGIYSQTIDRPEVEAPKVLTEAYKMIRVEMSLIQQARVLFGATYLSSFEDARRLWESANT